MQRSLWRIGGAAYTAGRIHPALVIAIILIGAGIAAIAGRGLLGISKASESMTRARFSEGLVVADEIKTPVVEYYFDHDDEWPASNGDLAAGLPPLPQTVQSASVRSGGVITVTFRSDIPELGGKSLIASPVVGKDQVIAWQCSAPDIAERFRALSCR